MTITRDVITDLLPLYLAGEASDDSNQLIQKFLEQDPDFAQLIQSANQEQINLIKEKTAVLPPDVELTTLTKTKQMLNWRSWLLGMALFFTASLFGFKSVGNGIEWLWAGWPVGFVICLITAVCAWIAYAILRHRLNNVGL